MATVKRHSVVIKKWSDVTVECVANAAITPGHLVEVMSTDKIRVHATAGGNVLPMFALEDELRGNDIDTAFVSLDPVQVWIPNRGDVVNAILADGQNIAIGDFLESAGDGTLTKHNLDTWTSHNTGSILEAGIVGQAIEAVDLSGSNATHPVSGLRIKVRIL